MYKIYTRKPGIADRYIRKIWLIMRITTIIIIASLMQVSAAGYAQRVTIKEHNASLEKVLKTIRTQSGYDIFYDGRDFYGVNPVDITVQNVSIEEALNSALVKQPLTYNIEGRVVVIRRKIPPVLEKMMAIFANIDVSGIVTDENGSALSGAFVRTENGIVAYVTSKDGRFYFRNISETTRLIVSYVGYQTDTVAVRGKRDLVIKMKPKTNAIAEVAIVSTGYQKLDKQTATGSFGKPDMEIFKNRTGTLDIMSRLDGLVPGVTVTSGPRGGTASRYTQSKTTQASIVRGKSSISLGTDPLYVVNGIVVPDLANLNPDDVMDITVLKDAAAAAIWGAQAANGVIVITTKSGGQNRPVKISYSGYANFQDKPGLDHPKYLTSSQYIQAARELFSIPAYISAYPYNTLSTSFVAPHEQLLYGIEANKTNPAYVTRANASLDSLANIDNKSQILDLWYRNAYTMNHTLSASGGGNVYSFYSSLSYADTHSSDIGASNKAYRINLNQTFIPNKRLTISLNTALNNTISSSLRPISIGGGFLPYQLFEDVNGNSLNMNYMFGFTPETRANYQARSRLNLDYNPIDEINRGHTNSKMLTISTTGTVNVKLIKGLSFDGTYGYQKSPGTNTSYNDASSYSLRRQLLDFTVAATPAVTPVYYLPTTGGTFTTNVGDQYNWTVRNQLVYNTRLRNNKDQLNIQAGQNVQENYQNITTNILRGYDEALQTYALLDYKTLANGVFGGISSGRSLLSEPQSTVMNVVNRYKSYYALLNYTFDDKYVFSSSYRQDKSNLFGSDQSAQKKPTYSFGGKWLIIKEGFMRNVNWLNDLGLRASYGVTGNSPYLGAASIFDVLYAQTSSVNGNSLSISSTANTKLSWESTRTTNIGIDFSMLNNRLGGSVDVYNKSTTDLLGSSEVNTLTGSQTTTGNIGNLSNRGIELSLRSRNVQYRDFSWSTGFIFSYNKNKLKSYYVNPSIPVNADSRVTATTVIGYSTNALFAYNYAGLDKVGDPQIKLADGTITKVPGVGKVDDLVYMGTTQPVFNGGLTNSFTYKRFSLSANMGYSLGHVMRREANNFYNGRLTGSAGSFSGGNISADFVNRWKVAGDEAFTNIPAYVPGFSSTRNISYYTNADINVVSASVIKLRDITLNYNIAPKILKAVKLQAVNVFIQGSNFMIWKANKYDMDPEGFYGHSYSFGANISF